MSETIKTFEFDEIAESRDFNHDHLFVKYSDHRDEVIKLQSKLTKAIEALVKIKSGEIRYHEQWNENEKTPDQFEFINDVLKELK